MSVVLLRGDARHLPLPDESVDLIACSPPYWSLRDYRDGGESLAGQIGSEDTPQEYVANLLDCTREWARVLKPTGSMFVNLADVYYSAKGNPGPNGTDPKNRARRGWERPTDRSGLGFPRKTLLALPARGRSSSCVPPTALPGGSASHPSLSSYSTTGGGLG